MSFVKITKNYQEYSSLVLRPEMLYISSSGGITGSQYSSHVRSNRFKDFEDYTTTVVEQQAGGVTYHDEEQAHQVTQDSLTVTAGKVVGLLPDNPTYLEAVNQSPVSARMRCQKLIKRIEPGKSASFTIDDYKKNTIRKNLSTFYKSKYPDAGWHYSNYHTINFFKTDNLPDDSCLMYANKDQMYTPTSSFTLSFHINPRYDNVTADAEFDAGTIFHMSSSLAVSLVSGSRTDKKGLVSSYKLLLQLSQSADTAPGEIDLSNVSSGYPNDLIYLSEIELSKNTWNHVAIRWSPDQNNMSGSLVINKRQTYFHVPSSSLMTENDAVILGNYYNGGADNLKKYFNAEKADSRGINSLVGTTAEPVNQSTDLNNPLQAEIHNVMLFDHYLNNRELTFISGKGVNNRKLRGSLLSSLYSKLIFYVPPYFIPESPQRSEVIVSPYRYIYNENASSPPLKAGWTGPFNPGLSFSLGARMINLENFVADLSIPKDPKFPRLQSLTGSILDYTVDGNVSKDNYIFNSRFSSQIKKRNLTILPNDNGLFSPDFFPIQDSYHSTSVYYQQSVVSFVSQSDNGPSNQTIFENIYDYSKISLENLVTFNDLYRGGQYFLNEAVDSNLGTDDYLNQHAGSQFRQMFGPYNNFTAGLSRAHENLYAIPAMTKDISSNEVTIFDISQLYYGLAVSDFSFSIIDDNVSGSDGKIRIKLKDNGKGSLYRADAKTRHAKWNNVGDIICEEGIVTVKSPHLIKFCKDKTNIKLKGEQTLHTMILNIPVLKDYFNSSSNVTYVDAPPTENKNDEHLTTKYITAVNIHDNNFNIIMKAHFSQPIVKTEEDEFIIRLKQDF